MRVNLINNSAYHIQSDHTSKIRSDEYCYPCIDNVGKNNEITNLWYSSLSTNGHFGQPKIVFGAFGTGIFIDYYGEYGITQNCSAIIDDKDKLSTIATVLQSNTMNDIMRAVQFHGVSDDSFNRRVLSLFKKDFYLIL